QNSADDPGTTSTTASTTPTSEPPAGLDADGDGMLDEPGAPPGHVEPPPPTEAPEVASLNHAVHEGFERVSVRFTGNLPPTAELHPDANRGVLRLWFPETSPTGGVDDAAIEQVFGGESELGLSAFLVVDRDGQAFVDIHADGPVTAESFRLITANDQPVIAVDIRTADGPWAPSTVTAGGVLLEPPVGGTLMSTGPILVEGYGRRSDGEGVVEMYDSGGAVVSSQEVSLPGGGDANGFFSIQLQPDAPLGPGAYDIRLTGGAIAGGPPAMVQTTVNIGE
ncbi:MAG: hypothetical protein PV358_16055, partial [Acidimicrobiales bacterium]|nr:hypothetical protein [Acidimicrobiales bacterium]